MKKGNIGLVLLALAASMLLSGCLKDDPQVGTIVLMGTESYVKSIEEVIPDTLLKVMDELPQGNTPPDIQGEFVLNNKELLWTNAWSIAAGDSICMRFGGGVDTLGCYPEGQHNRVVPLDYLEEEMLMHTDTAFLMGSGDSFAAYFELTQKHIKDIEGVDFNLKRGYVITGIMRRSGDAIDNVQVAYINLDLHVNSNSPTSGVPDEFIEAMEGFIYVFGAQDNAPMVRHKWFD